MFTHIGNSRMNRITQVNQRASWKCSTRRSESETAAQGSGHKTGDSQLHRCECVKVAKDSQSGW